MEKVINQLYSPIQAFVRNRIDDVHVADDITQEVFLKLIKSDTTQIDNLRSWVYAIARNTITDHYRKKKLPTDDVDAIILPDSPADVDVVEDLSCCLFKYIELLPEDYREIMRLAEVEQLSQKEIADRLDMNYATVRSRVQRGRKLMKELFSQCCAVEQGGRGSIMGYTVNL